VRVTLEVVVVALGVILLTVFVLLWLADRHRRERQTLAAQIHEIERTLRAGPRRPRSVPPMSYRGTYNFYEDSIGGVVCVVDRSTPERRVEILIGRRRSGKGLSSSTQDELFAAVNDELAAVRREMDLEFEIVYAGESRTRTAFDQEWLEIILAATGSALATELLHVIANRLRQKLRDRSSSDDEDWREKEGYL
jgi:hypothetical protein